MLESAAEFSYPPVRSQIGPACRRLRATAGNQSRAVGGWATDLALFAALLGRSSHPPDGMAAQPCLNLTEKSAPDRSPGARAWDWLACTEIVHPIAANNITDFFPPYTFSLARLAAECQAGMQEGRPGWPVVPRPRAIPDEFGLSHLSRFGRLPSSTSRIVFSYGLDDPWHTSGLPLFQPRPHQLNAETELVAIKGGSHCADTAPPDNTTDTPAMVAARQKIEQTLQRWLAVASEARRRS